MTVMHRQYRRPMSHDLPLNIYRKISKISPSSPPLRLLSSQNWLLEPVFLSALFAFHQGSVLLDNGLVTALNETLFERQRLSHFSIDPTPYTGTDLRSPKPSTQYQERRRVLPSPSGMLKTFYVSITKRILVFQSSPYARNVLLS